MDKKITNQWIYNENIIDCIDKFPIGAIGVIYRIDNLTNGKYYFGRKTCISNRKKKLTIAEKKLEENKRKTFKYEICETSGWKTYRGLNKPLLADLNSGHLFTKTIIQFCFSKTEMTFYETRAITCSDCMLTEQCYNDWFSAKVYKSHLIGKKK
jgi:Putative endonuclease segE, GIY-YIG domain